MRCSCLSPACCCVCRQCVVSPALAPSAMDYSLAHTLLRRNQCAVSPTIAPLGRLLSLQVVGLCPPLQPSTLFVSTFRMRCACHSPTCCCVCHQCVVSPALAPCYTARPTRCEPTRTHIHALPPSALSYPSSRTCLDCMPKYCAPTDNPFTPSLCGPDAMR